MKLQDLKELCQIIIWRVRQYFLLFGHRLFKFFVPRRARFLFDDDEGESYGDKFFGKLGTCFVALPILYWLFPSYMPFRFLEFWHMPSSWTAVAHSYWPLFLWALLIQGYSSFRSRNDPDENRDAEVFLITGFIRSGFAGFTEEITFRWLFLLIAIPSAQLSNWIALGFWKVEYGLYYLIHMYIMGPVVNLVSMGKIQHLLYHPRGWFVGAALITTNAFFRDGHKYQGPKGYVNSWFGGLVFFHAAFTYGLLCGILLHTAYNCTVYTVAYIDAVIERRFFDPRPKTDLRIFRG